MTYIHELLWGRRHDPEGERMDHVAAMISDYDY